MLVALIMAGGRGTRFWPLSTDVKPKQFLKLVGDRTMIQKTVDRVTSIIPVSSIFVCTNARYKKLVNEQLPELPNDNVILEPDGRNTAPCITLSTLLIRRKFPDANILVLPSDQLVTNEESFRNTVLHANVFVENNKSAIVTFGMQPTRPETGYGYIKTHASNESMAVTKVERFVEKPNLESALSYIESEQYLWNGGMFLWSVDTILSELKRYAKKTTDALHFLDTTDTITNMQIRINQAYAKTEAMSIDYAVMEKAQNVFVIRSDFGWDDVGSWQALDRYRSTDEFGNLKIGKLIRVDGENNLLVATDQEVIVSDVSDLYVIQNENKIFVGQRCKLESDIKRIKDEVG